MNDAELRMVRRLSTKRAPSIENIDSVWKLVPGLVEEVERGRATITTLTAEVERLRGEVERARARKTPRVEAMARRDALVDSYRNAASVALRAERDAATAESAKLSAELDGAINESEAYHVRAVKAENESAKLRALLGECASRIDRLRLHCSCDPMIDALVAVIKGALR